MMLKSLLTLMLLFSLISCHSFHKRKACPKEGLAEIRGVSGSSVKGYVKFFREDCRNVKIEARIQGLKPNSQSGFHIHKFGSCSNKAQAAGPHLNPYKGRHGHPDHRKGKKNHLGDLGNLQANSQGVAEFSYTLKKARLHKLIGRSVVVHEGPDDFTSQPAGKSGPRKGCGIIGIVK